MMSTLKIVFRMLKLVKKLIIPMIIAVLLGVLGFCCAISIPVICALVVMQQFGMFVHIPMAYLLVILLSSAILRGILHYGEQALNHYIAFKLLAVIRDRVYTALRRLAPAKLDGKDKGNLISLITNDIELLEVFYAHTISPVCIAMIMLLVLLKFFMHMHIAAMIVALIDYLIMAIVIPLFVHYFGNEIGEKNRDEIGNLSHFFLESYRGISTIIQYQLGNCRIQEMDNKSTYIEGLQNQMKTIESYQLMISQLFISLSALIMFTMMYFLYLQRQTGVFDVIMSTVLILSSFGPFLALSQLSNHLLSTLSSAKRVLSLLDEQEIVKDVLHQPQAQFGKIQVNDVSFSYQDNQVLKNICCQCLPHHILGIRGKSGSGKSTLLKLMMRFYDPESGYIRIQDRHLPSINTKNLRYMFAYVTQETVLFHDTIYNNILIARLDATQEEVIEACQKAQIHDFIMSLPQGYQTIVSELGGSLSGGECQRIGLARAFLSQAKCILLDEPTSQLDVLNEGMILKALKNQKDQTMILVSHRLSTLNIVDDLMTIENGQRV